MNFGSLRHRLVYQEQSPRPDAATRDDYGAPVKGTWTDIGVVYGDVRGLSSREILQASRVDPERVRVVTIRRPTFEVRAEGRFKEGTAYYSLTGPPIDPNGRGEAYRCYTLETVGATQ